MLYTDGILEARDKSGQEYSLKRLTDCLNEPCPTAEAYTDHILDHVKTFAKGVEQHDDMTVLTLKIPD